MKKIDSQEDLDVFVSIPDWADAFVRECYILSPSYIYSISTGVFAPDALPTLKVLICTQDIECPGIELMFVEIENIVLIFNCDMCPNGKYHNNHLDFSFSQATGSAFRCKEMYYRILDQKCWDTTIRYGKENFYTEEGFLNFNILNE